MNIDPSNLAENGYVELDRLQHKELIPFIKTYLRKFTKFSAMYYLANAVVFVFACYAFTNGTYSSDNDIGNKFTHFCYGLAIAFGLIPVHEYIHVLAYKSQGAKNTSYDANIRKFYFMALANKFVANRKEFQVVALAPFVVITATLVLLLLFSNKDWILTIIGVLLAHTAMCSGDFGLLSYFESHRDKDVVTYDDIGNGVSYFFGKQMKE